MSEYNELYQAVQPESPQVVPDEVRFVYIPKAQKGTAGLAWFNEEHFTVSDDSEVSLSATVLGDINKKLDKHTEQPESGHGQVYAIYGDSREGDRQTMWDLDDTGQYHTYHIPCSDGYGYIKVRDPYKPFDAVNKQTLEAGLKTKLDDLGKTSGVFPAAYVRQQGMVVSHDYGKSIEVNSGTTAYTIPVRTIDGTLQTATPKDGNDAVNLDYLQNYNTKILHIEAGTGSRSLKFNVTQNNDALSGATNAFGNNTVAGLIGVRYNAITNTADEQSLTLIGSVSGSPFEVGDELNIVNDSKYDRSCKFVKYENGKIYVDKLPFTEIVSGDTAIDAYMISSYMNPQINGVSGSAVASYGIAAFAVGADVKAVNAYTFGAGSNNIIYGEYGTAFGRDNEVGYCGFAAGRNNDCYGQYGTVPGGSENKVNASWGFATGRANSINGRYAGSFGWNNSAGVYGYYFTNDGSGNDILLYSDSACTKPADCEYGLGDTLSAGIGARYINAVTITAIDGNKVTTSARLNLSDYSALQRFLYCEQKPDVGATSVTALQTALGLQNTVLGEKSVGIGAYNAVPSQYGVALGYDNRAGYSGVSAGTNNKTNKEYCVLIGNNNSSEVNLTTEVGHGLKSKTTHQNVFGKYNDDSSTDPFVFGYGTSDARKNLATITADGSLRLLGDKIVLDSSNPYAETLTLSDMGKIHHITGSSTFSSNQWTWNGSFKPNTLSVTYNADVKGNLTVAGNFNVTGTTTVTDIKNLAIEDLTITLAKDNFDPLTSMAGLIVPNYMGESSGYTGGLVFDSKGIAYVGDVEVNSNGTVSRGDAKMIMASEMDDDHPGTDGGLLAWDASTMTAYTTELKYDQLLAKQTGTGTGYNLYAYKGNDQTSLSVAEAGTAYTVPRRTEDGVVRGETKVGVTDSYVNVKTAESRYVPLSHDSGPYRVYCHHNSVETVIPASTSPGAFFITQYDAQGQLATWNGNLTNNTCTNYSTLKSYAVQKQTEVADTSYSVTTDEKSFIYGHGQTSTGAESDLALRMDFDGNGQGMYAIPMMDADGNVFVASYMWEQFSEDSKLAVNLQAAYGVARKVVDEKITIPQPSNTPKTGSMLMIDGYDSNYDVWTSKWVDSSNEGIKNGVPLYDSNGNLWAYGGNEWQEEDYNTSAMLATIEAAYNIAADLDNSNYAALVPKPFGSGSVGKLLAYGGWDDDSENILTSWVDAPTTFAKYTFYYTDTDSNSYELKFVAKYSTKTVPSDLLDEIVESIIPNSATLTVDNVTEHNTFVVSTISPAAGDVIYYTDYPYSTESNASYTSIELVEVVKL